MAAARRGATLPETDPKKAPMASTLTPDNPAAADNGTPVPGPGGPPPQTDQERFDAAVKRDTRIVLQVLGGVAVVAALAMSTIALLVSTGRGNTTTTVTTRGPVAAVPSAVSSAPNRLSVAGENKMGPDGKKHDSFSKTNFAVKVGQPTRLRIDNKDDVPHTISSPATGVSITVRPGVHTYALVAKNAGRFEWTCALPCDGPTKGWAMNHPGYMAGYITAA
jgi:hypothetical protein